MKRKGIIMLAAALCTALFASAAMAVDVATPQELTEALAGNEDINVTSDMSGNIMFIITKDTNINLGGYTITRNHDTSSSEATPVFYITNGKLTLSNGTIKSANNDGIAEGARVQPSDAGADAAIELNSVNIDSSDNALSIYADTSGGNLNDKPTYKASAVVNGNSLLYGKGVGAFVIGKQASLTLNDGEIKSDAFAISGNGRRDSVNNGGTLITINGGKVVSEQTCAIYQPQAGTINITGGTVTGYDGIQMKAGTLNMSGGTLEGTGAFDDSYTYPVGQNDGSMNTGAALSILSHGSVGDTGYAGEMSVNISGDATLVSKFGYAIAEANMNVAGTENKFSALNITGGTFTGAEGKSAVAMTNASDENTTITAGTFSTDLATCEGLTGLTNLPQTAKDENGNYYVVVNAESIAFETNAIELAMNETFTLRVIFTPDNTTEKALTWSSSDEKVATVDTDGKITPVAPGTAIITAALADDDSVYATCTVTVTEEEVPPTPPVTSDDVKPQPSGSGGGGCSAGFGALSLLAALPLLRMRKK